MCVESSVEAIAPIFCQKCRGNMPSCCGFDLASAPPPIAVRRTAAHLLRHAILLDFQCAFASDSGGAKPSKWRPATAAAFAKRWEKLCTRANGRPRFHGLIETPRDTSP